MQFMRRHDRQYEPVLVAREVETGNEHRIQFWFSRVDSHDGPDGTWADLTPTNEPNTYILTRTSQMGGVYPEYEITFWDSWLHGDSRSRLVSLPEPIATGPFMYTYNGRFRYRLEDTYLNIQITGPPRVISERPFSVIKKTPISSSYDSTYNTTTRRTVPHL